MADDQRKSRRWALKLAASFVLVLAALLAGGYWVWQRSAARRLNGEVALLKAEGEAIEPGDFDRRALPDADNAAVELLAGYQSLNEASDAWKACEEVISAAEIALPLTPNERSAFQNIIAANPELFAAVDRAMQRKSVAWKYPTTSPVLAQPLGGRWEQTRVHLLLLCRAFIAHEAGDDAAGIADLRRALFVAAAVDAQPTLILHQIASSCRIMHAAAIEQIAATMTIGSSPPAASRAQVSELIATLLNDVPQRQRRHDAFLFDGMIVVDTARRVSDGTVPGHALHSLRWAQIGLAGRTFRARPPSLDEQAGNYAARTVALGDGLVMLRHMTATMRASDQATDWPTFDQLAPPYPLNNDVQFVRHMVAAMILPSNYTVRRSFEAITDQRLAAVALAVRCYAVDHDGKLPATLEELVPAYLPRVPADAMAGGAPPLKYLPRPDKPIVYSVGGDGVDDGGDERGEDGRPTTERDRMTDAVMHLSVRPRMSPPTTE